MTQRKITPIVFLAVGLGTVICYAQETRASLRGRVVDISGAVVVNTTVTATNLSTNVAVSAVSNNEGTYFLPYLVPGTYRVTAEQTGFKKFIRNGISLEINAQVELDVQLEPGNVNEQVTVTAESPLLQTANANVGQVIDQQRLADLPVLHGNPMLLIQTSPAVTSVALGMSFADSRAGDNARLTEYGVAGTPASSHEVTLDGASNTTTSGGTSAKQETIAFVPPSELLSEFKVEAASFDASTGNSAGGVINMSLKSGTNDLHGAIRYSRIQTGWNANNFFANKFGQPRTYIKDDHWVASASGPVLLPHIYNGKNRTFFLYGFEHQVDDSPYGGGNFSVPTAKERQGDFSDLLRLGAAYQIYDPSSAALVDGHVTRQPFPGNIIPTSRITPISEKILSYYPQPKNAGLADGTNNYPFPGLLDYYGYWSHTVRLDQYFGSKQRIFGRVYIGEKDETYRDYFQNLSTGVAGVFANRGVALDHVYTISSSTVMNLRYSFTRFLFPHNPKSQGMDLTTLGFSPDLVRQLDPEGISFPQISVSGLTAIGNEKPDSMHTNTHQIVAAFDHVNGKHIWKFGVDWRAYQENYYNWGADSPSFTFGANWVTAEDSAPSAPVGMGLASLLLGLPTAGSVARNASYAVQSTTFGSYVQDDWRLSPKLTVNLGLRYEVETPLRERFNRTIRGFDTSTVNPLQAQVQSAYAENPTPEIPAAQFVVKGGPLYAGVGGQPSALFETPKADLMPRIGIAYRLADKTVVRAGYGIFYAYVGQQRGEKVKQTGFSQTTAMVPSADGGLTFAATLANPFPDGILVPVGAANGLSSNMGNAISFFDSNPKAAYSQRWQLSVQHEFPKGILLDVAYVGNRGTHIEMTRTLDPFDSQYLSRSPVRDQTTINYLTQLLPNPFYPLLPNTGLAAAVLPRASILSMANYPQFTSVTSTEDSGSSWYHSLQLEVQRKFANGFTAQAGYTWSKLMMAASRLNGELSPLEHVIASADRPHRLTVNGIYELPFGPGKPFNPANVIVSRLVSGWQLDGLYIYQAGAPLGFGDALLLGTGDLITLSASERNTDHWFNTAVFNRNPAQQLSYNYITLSSLLSGVRAPGLNSLNASVIKNNRLFRERVNLQLRGEAINVLNHPNFAAPNTSPTSSAFGTITSTTVDARILQLGFRVVW